MTSVFLVKEFPLHGTKADAFKDPAMQPTIKRFQREVWDKWQNRPLLLGPPIQPTKWNCDTDLIWPVLDTDFVQDCGKKNPIVWLCRHMFEGDDDEQNIRYS